MLVRLLGPPAMVGSGGPVVLQGRRQAALLALLAAEPQRSVGRDRLVEEIWEGRRVGGGSLPVLVNRVRRQFVGITGSDPVRSADQAYRLDCAADDVDSMWFTVVARQVLEAERQGDDEAVVLGTRRAVALWQATPFEGIDDLPSLVIESRRLGALRADIEQASATAMLRLGDDSGAEAVLVRLAADEPYREAVWGLLMVALYRRKGRSPALAAYQRFRSALGEDLGLEPTVELRRVEAAVLAGEPAERVGRQLLQRSLPGWAPRGGAASPDESQPMVVSDLLGRDDDVASVLDLLDRNRVVSVVGLGGVGKSRLVREVAAFGVTRVLYVDVEALESGSRVWSQVATRAGVEGHGQERIDAVVARLGGQEQLVLLDGCEHHLEETADVVSHLTSRCPALRVLTTSRLALSVPGEVVFTLGPLGTAGEGSPAAQLLCDRTGRPYCSLASPEQSAADTIARAVDGMPLALELLASLAAVRPMSLLEADVRAALAEDGRGVGPVDDAIRYGLDQLDVETRSTLAALAELPAGFAADTAAALSSGEPRAPHRALAPLLQHGLLLSFRARNDLRYRISAMVRTAVTARSGEAERRAHRSTAVLHLTELAQAVGDGLRAPRLDYLPRVEAEWDNLDGLLDATVGTVDGLALAVACGQAWQEAGRTVTGTTWMERHLDAIAVEDVDPLLRGRALVLLVNMPGHVAHLGVNREQAEEAAAIAREAGDLRLLAVATAFIVMAAGWAGDRRRADELLNGPEALTVLEALDDPWLWENRRRLVGLANALDGKFEQAHRTQVESADRFLELGDPSSAVSALHSAVMVARLAGRPDLVEADLRRARELASTGGARRRQALVSLELALLEHGRRSPEAPTLLQGAVEELERVGNLPAAASARRELGVSLVRIGEREAGAWQLRTATQLLLGVDDRGAGLALVELAGLDAEARRVHEAAVLAGSAERLLGKGQGFGLEPHQQRRVDQVCGDLRQEEGFTGGERLGEDELRALLAEPAQEPSR